MPPVGRVAAPPGRGYAIAAEVTFTSPGLPPSRMDAQGRLVEDWGPSASRDRRRTGPDRTGHGPKPQAGRPDSRRRGATQLRRGALHPDRLPRPGLAGGLDVLTVRLAETAGQETPVQLSLALPERAASA